MKELYQKLQGCPLFDGIEEHDLAGMLGCLGAKPVSTRKGQPSLQPVESEVVYII